MDVEVLQVRFAVGRAGNQRPMWLNAPRKSTKESGVIPRKTSTHKSSTALRRQPSVPEGYLPSWPSSRDRVVVISWV